MTRLFAPAPSHAISPCPRPAAYGVFLEGGLSATELRSFLDRELPERLDQLEHVIAPAVRNADSLSAREHLARTVGLILSRSRGRCPCPQWLAKSLHQQKYLRNAEASLRASG